VLQLPAVLAFVFLISPRRPVAFWTHRSRNGLCDSR
jgi:hypothetical protein